MKLSDFSIKRPVFTLVIMFLIIILGVVSFTRIPITLIPELNPPIGVVVTNYPGASPTEVSEKVTKPLEANLSTLPGIKSIQSNSQEGSNFILLEFDWSTNIDDVQTDIMQRIDQTPIPDDSNDPRFLKFDPSQFPILQLSLRSSDPDADVRVVAEELETELRQTDGVASVNISGSLIEEIQIELDQAELEERGLQQSDVVQLIQANNISLPGEPIETEDGRNLTTRIISTLTSVEEIRDLILTIDPIDGNNVTIADVAEVNVSERESNSETRANEEPAVLLSALQESQANTAEVSDAFQERLDELLSEERFEGVQADVLFDQGDYVKLAIGNIGQTLILGGIFAMLVLFFFLRGIKSPIIIGVAIPYSVIVTFVLMFFADFALNILTLGALALGIGMLVDNAIVVIENIERHLAMGKNSKKAASEGAREVSGAIIASTLTTVAVFIPVIFISGLIGEIFFEFALTISFSLFASLAVALTVIPMMASRMLGKPGDKPKVQKDTSKSVKAFEGSVIWALRHRIIVLLTALVLLVVGAFGIMQVGTEFIPATDEGFVSVSVELENGSSRTATDEVVNLIEEELKDEEDVEVYVSLIGSTQQGQAQGSAESNTAEIYVKLVDLADRDRSVFEFVDEVQPRVLEAVGERALVNFNLQTAAGSSPNTLSFTVTDTERPRLDDAVADIEAALLDLPEITELTNDRQETIDEIQMTIDRDAATEYGLPPAQIAQSVNNITRGVLATQVLTENDEVLSVYVAFDEEERNSLEKLRTLSLRTPSGEFVELQELADIEVAQGPVSIQRVDQADSVTFTLQHQSSITLGDMSDKVDAAIEELNLEENTMISFGGDRELLDNSINDMMLAVVLAIVLVYIVMAAQFESFKYPLVIMFTVPLMAIGVAIALFVTQTPISITAVIGILVLVGIVVNNGIVLVDYINQRKAAGMQSYEAIVTSVHDRRRPILMTALTTILGLLPLAIGIGEGTEINQPMGITVIGGLISSTLLSLYIVPIVYSLFDRQTRRMNKK
ncbi:efflux RND transporter permease subunit [Microbacterium sp. APC 3898]|uniref:Efflux RND transporter permease subunit n=2 Tax=Planococcus TaxID=1372 RepID=A0ABT7ZFQ7_9BACL|nr:MULTISPECIES: efflux RND transporter permease subunit [Terrabacteria group]MBD8013677.1 efflux RND transporter permease subunit [Planococcus wigleyi]MDN3425980.1 efflux RND transporter permease subunit [Planococcus sp. APC 4016]MDN3437574.1 efflux RND transporter permease subunit [Planococcus sp. APC 3900]MDN3497677.1 efflux RND transporter permease subunit [Microbacterium sp. APC 3898]